MVSRACAVFRLGERPSNFKPVAVGPVQAVVPRVLDLIGFYIDERLHEGVGDLPSRPVLGYHPGDPATVGLDVGAVQPPTSCARHRHGVPRVAASISTSSLRSASSRADGCRDWRAGCVLTGTPKVRLDSAASISYP